MNKRSATQAYKENTAAIKAAITELQAGLKQHAKEQAEEPQDWGYAGDASYVLELLQQAVNFNKGEEE